MFLSIVLILFVFPICAQDLSLIRGEEPAKQDTVEGFSDVFEPRQTLPLKYEFSGESVWRFRSNKPSADNFTSTTPNEFVNPLYLYNRTSLSWRTDSSGKLGADFTLLRRDNTAFGASEPPVSPDNFGKGYLLRNWSIAWENPDWEVMGGDFLLGWGQGLALSARPGDSYRPFLIKKTEVDLNANRSSYDNNGFFGVGAERSWSGWKAAFAFTRTPLDGRLSSDGAYVEDLRTLRDRYYGELGRTLDLERQDALHEMGGILRIEKRDQERSIGFGFAAFSFDHRVEPNPSIDQPGIANSWAWAFRGDTARLLSADIVLPIRENAKFSSEAAFSFWEGHVAPACVFAVSQEKTTLGAFYLSPFYFSRQADAVRWGSAVAANRQGFFASHFQSLSSHNLGAQFFLDQNIKSEFSGDNQSHGQPGSRVSSQLRLDDDWELTERVKLYGRWDISREPYFVDARYHPETIDIWDARWRLEGAWETKAAKFALGFDYAQNWAQHFSAEKTYGRDIYFRSSIKPVAGMKLAGKIAYFDLGAPLFGNHYLYMSSIEPYWSRTSLGSIVYESLFASYAPRGVRVSCALEQAIGDEISLWVKLGNTILARNGLPDVPANSSDRDDLIGRMRWDFKTELTLKW